MKKVKFQQIIFPISLVLICISFNLLESGHFSAGKSLGSDQKLYNSIALALLHGNNFYMEGDTKVDLGHEVTPFYSSFVAIAYFIGGVNVKNAYILNIIFNCLTIVLLFYTIFLITGRRLISFLFSFLFIFYYLLWRMNFSIMMEVTTVFFLSLSVFLFVKFFFNKKLSYLYFSALSFSVLTLINNRFIVLLSIFYLVLIILVILKKATFLKSFFIPVVIAILAISPWFIRQYNVYGQFVFFTPTWNNVVANTFGLPKKINIVTDADYKNLNKPLNYNEYVTKLGDSASAELLQIRTSNFTKAKYKEIINRHNSNENIYFARLKKYFTLYYKDFQFNSPKDFRLIAPSSKTNKLVQIFILLPLFLLSLLGLIIAINKREVIVIFLGGLFLSHVLLHVFVHYIDRYRLTILPVLVIIAAYGFENIFTCCTSLWHKYFWRN